jgi:hypothetical protein
VKRWAIENLVAWDRAVNALFGGSADETISTRWGRYMRRHGHALPWYIEPIARLVDALDPGHFERAKR